MTVASNFCKTKGQVLSDHLLLGIGLSVGGNHGPFMLDPIAWK
jgi:hypothetical protein